MNNPPLIKNSFSFVIHISQHCKTLRFWNFFLLCNIFYIRLIDVQWVALLIQSKTLVVVLAYHRFDRQKISTKNIKDFEHPPVWVTFHNLVDGAKTLKNVQSNFFPIFDCRICSWRHYKFRTNCSTIPDQKIIIETLSSLNTFHDKDSCTCVVVHIFSVVEHDVFVGVALFLLVLVLETLATTFTITCAHGIKQVSYPPTMKLWINSPNGLPVTL